MFIGRSWRWNLPERRNSPSCYFLPSCTTIHGLILLLSLSLQSAQERVSNMGQVYWYQRAPWAFGWIPVVGASGVLASPGLASQQCPRLGARGLLESEEGFVFSWHPFMHSGHCSARFMALWHTVWFRILCPSELHLYASKCPHPAWGLWHFPCRLSLLFSPCYYPG